MVKIIIIASRSGVLIVFLRTFPPPTENVMKTCEEERKARHSEGRGEVLMNIEQLNRPEVTVLAL